MWSAGLMQLLSLQMYQDAESKQVLLEWMKERQEIRWCTLSPLLKRGLPGLHWWVCSVTCLGDSGTTAVGLWSSLMCHVFRGDAAVQPCSLGVRQL